MILFVQILYSFYKVWVFVRITDGRSTIYHVILFQTCPHQV